MEEMFTSTSIEQLLEDSIPVEEVPPGTAVCLGCGKPLQWSDGVTNPIEDEAPIISFSNCDPCNRAFSKPAAN